MSIGVQQELAPRVSLEVTYVRRSWGNQTVTDNRAYTRSRLRSVWRSQRHSDPRLPNGGGYRVEGIYELKADRPFGRVDNFVTHAEELRRWHIRNL